MARLNLEAFKALVRSRACPAAARTGDFVTTKVASSKREISADASQCHSFD